MSHDIKIVSHLQRWPIQRLIPYAGNPRTHSGEQVRQIAQSMKDLGVVNPILVDSQGTVIAGHGRILAAQSLQLTELPVIVLDHLTEAQASFLRIADNRIAENAGWDQEKLLAEVAKLIEQSLDATALGFNERELERILAKIEPHRVAVEPQVAMAQPPVTQRGDLWILGPHRLLCGDATSLDDLRDVLEARCADLIYTDPPYNVAYAGPQQRCTAHHPILNDSLGQDFGKFLQQACTALLSVAGGAIYISMASSELHTLHQAFTNAGGHWSTFLIWVKDSFTLGRSDYQRQYEPILYGWKRGQPHFFCGDRNLGDVWFIDRPRANDLHPTMKPVELIERAIRHSSRPGALVLDPFAGSGSTMVACHNTQRHARLIELDPIYVDTVIRRWEEVSGIPATLSRTGQSFAEVTLERQNPSEHHG